MADPFVAEIRIFPFSFAPRGWALCDGQLMAISQNTALFSLLGTTYGGDGRSTFALPNMQGNAPMHPGQGLGLSDHYLGEMEGTQTVSLIDTEMPQHFHFVDANAVAGDTNAPASNVSLARSANASAYQTTTNTNIVQLSPATVAPTGNSQPHENMQPYLTLNFCIALQGVYPPRS